jgi:hypothetical protein
MTVAETFNGNKLASVSTPNTKKPQPTKKVLTVGTASVVLQAGQTRRVQIALNGAGRRLLSSRGKLRVSLVVTQTVGGRTNAVSSQKLIFKATKRKHTKTH